MDTTTYPKEITNSEDIIDLRDVIERIEHLRKLRQPGPVDLGPEDNEQAQDDLFAELVNLEALIEVLRGNGGNHDWDGSWFPITLIRDSYFEEYAEELAGDIGAIDSNAKWPLNHINWADAAEQLKGDYFEADFNGEVYWCQ